MRKLLENANTPVIALLALALFVALAQFSLHKKPEQGYNRSVFDVLSKSLLEKQAIALKDIYGIKDGELASDIWGK